MNKTKLIAVLAMLLFASLACNTVTNALNNVVTEAASFSNSSPSLQPTAAPFTVGDPPSSETRDTLENTIVPENNPVELAERFQGIQNISDTVPPHGPFEVGDHYEFTVLDSYFNQTQQKDTVLAYKSDLLYFWVEDGVDFEQSDLERLAKAFEEQMVPTNRAFFGNEWIPGVDNDPHIYIVYTTEIGLTAAGVFVSQDELNPLAEPDSNAAELFMVNAENTPLWSDYAYTVLAHEFQHMIHWYRDRNESSWINEGMSELATVLNGYYYSGNVREYLFNPDVQLTDWGDDPGLNGPHYGVSLLFLTYFLDRFGPEATQMLVGDQANSLQSVDDVLQAMGVTDSVSSEPLTADEVVIDWAVANYLNDSSLVDGRYGYDDYEDVLVVTTEPGEYVSICNDDVNFRNVHQYGVDYIELGCSGQTTLHFEGASGASLLPAEAYSGNYAFWSNKGDESDMTLTRAFDFTGISGPITFDYQTWFDIEEDWDYAYLTISTNGGETWDFLKPSEGTSTNPLGGNYGYGYTGLSGGTGDWIEQSVDLSAYAGQQVMLRFEYITDAAVNGEGLLVDDISIPEIGYFEDFEAGDGGWDAAGFARVDNVLPQTFKLAVISKGDETTVQTYDLSDTTSIDIPLDFNSLDEAVLVVVGTTRFTRTPASYSFSFSQ